MQSQHYGEDEDDCVQKFMGEAATLHQRAASHFKLREQDQLWFQVLISVHAFWSVSSYSAYEDTVQYLAARKDNSD